MKNWKPVNARAAPSCRLAGFEFPASGFLFLLFVFFALCVREAVSAQGNSAVVTGAEHVFIRRGPGTEFPPFATLTEGSTVEIQEIQGEWARVLTASGQSGYVNSNFLALPGERPAAPSAGAVASPPARPTPPATPTHAPAAQSRALTEQNKSLTEEVTRLQQELTALKAQAEATPAPAPTAAPAAGDIDKLHSEVARLTTAVEQLQHRLEAEPPKENVVPLANLAPNLPSGAPAHVVTSTAILLTAVGLCVGWLLGNAYGRRLERGRRPRVRL